MQRYHGELAEWTIAAALNTVEGKTSVGSNPTLAAKINKLNRVTEIEFSWGNREVQSNGGQPWYGSWGVYNGSFICEELSCEDCEFRFACFTTADVVIEVSRTFNDYHSAMKYRSRLRKRFPRSRVND